MNQIERSLDIFKECGEVLSALYALEDLLDRDTSPLPADSAGRNMLARVLTRWQNDTARKVVRALRDPDVAGQRER